MDEKEITALLEEMKALKGQMALPAQTAELVKNATKMNELPATWEEAVDELLIDHDVWEKHSLTQLVTENHEHRQTLTALAGALEFYTHQHRKPNAMDENPMPHTKEECEKWKLDDCKVTLGAEALLASPMVAKWRKT